MQLTYRSHIVRVQQYQLSPYLKNMVETSLKTDMIDDSYDMSVLEELDINEMDLEYYCKYIDTGNIDTENINLVLFNYMGHNTDILIDVEYYACYLRDEWICTMSNNLDPTYGLIKLEKELSVKKWYEIDYLACLETLFPGMNYIVSGGYAISQYRKKKYTDIDIYFLDDEIDRAIELIKRTNIIYRSNDAITFLLRQLDVRFQLIIRRYRSITELLHSFDIDCCSIAIYKRQFYSTWKCKYELDNNVIVVDWRKMSTTYPSRLYKYECKGFRLQFPDIVTNMARGFAIKLVQYINMDDVISRLDIVVNENTYIRRCIELNLEPNPTNIEYMYFMDKLRSSDELSTMRLTNLPISLNVVSEFILLSLYKFIVKGCIDYDTITTTSFDIQDCHTLEDLLEKHNI